MTLERLKTRAVVAAAATGLAALGVGGYLFAGHGHVAASTASQQVRLTSAPATKAAGTTATQPKADVADAPDATAEPAEQPGAEADGPGGWADTAANADTQQTGEH